jgi:antitoxin component of MazEF toxin-antitoxin module
VELLDTTRVVKYGDSLYVRLPRSVCKILKIVKGDPMNIFRDGETVAYKKEDGDENNGKSN